MVATAKMTPAKFFAKLAGVGFRFNSTTAKGVVAEKGSDGKATLACFESVLGATRHPPGPLTTMLGEQVVHGEDIRRPLGMTRRYRPDVLAEVASFYQGTNLLLGGKKRVSGFRLRASDTDWSTGDGPEVVGPMTSLVLVIAGRRPALDALTGEGVATLAART
ncbi:MAG TPA: hypothetical protein VME46_19375 [Acidimicrobiales bacterium]|nr:hypothetical protein [Acidimicrobiales bacterium]